MKAVLLDDFCPITHRHLSLIDELYGKYRDDFLVVIVENESAKETGFNSEATLKECLKRHSTDSLNIVKLVDTNLNSLERLLHNTEYVISGLDNICDRISVPIDAELKKVKKETINGSKLNCPEAMLFAIADRELFFVRDIHKRLTDERFLHSISVAKTAYEIAKHHNLEYKDDLFLAGLLHDVAKNIEKPEMRKMISNSQYSEFVNFPGFSLHQFASAIIAEQYFGITDKNILSSILYHCTGKAHMSMQEMIVYTADKCEPTRQFATKHIREESYKSVENAFRMTIYEQLEYFRRHNIDYKTNPLTEEMYNYYFEEDIRNAYKTKE